MNTYPVRVGSCLFTLVDPERGHEVAYNRWYERDHFYAGCLVGPWLFAGRRWVATRDLKDLRFSEDSPLAVPVDAGSYLAVYWVHEGRHREHFAWAIDQVVDLYKDGRGFDNRVHAHTVLVVGVGPGLGASCARLALRDGANVAVMARNAERLSAAAAELDPTGDRIVACPVDAPSLGCAGYTSTIRTVTPSAASSGAMSLRSEVTTPTSPRRAASDAVTATDASITSAVPVCPQRMPASRAI